MILFFEFFNENIDGMLLLLLLLEPPVSEEDKECLKEIKKIVEHPIKRQEGFKTSLFSKELESFIRRHCDQNKIGVAEKLYERGVYRRMIHLLDDLNEQLSRKEGSYLNVVRSYEKRLQLLYRLSQIAEMRHKVSPTLNKVSGHSYMALTYYSGFLAKFTHERRNFRILNNLDKYTSKTDPKIYEDAENLYFKETLETYDKFNDKNKDVDDFKLL